MGYWRRLAGLIVLGIALFVGYCVDVRWPSVVLVASSGALLLSWITAYRVSRPLSAGASIVGGAVGAVIMGYMTFPWIKVDTPPHLVFVLAGCSIGLAVYVLLGPRRVNTQEECDVHSCVRSGVSVVMFGVLMGPCVCLVTLAGPMHFIFSPFIGGIAGMILACPFAIQAVRCRRQDLKRGTGSRNGGRV